MKNWIQPPHLFGFLLGIYATLLQVILLREALVICAGNEISLGASLFIWLIFVGAGALPAQAIRRTKLALLTGAGLALPLFGLAMLSLRFHTSIISVEPGQYPSILQLFGLFGISIGPLAASVGFLFSASSKYLLHDYPHSPKQIYIAEAAGALASGVVFTFYLSETISHLACGLIACGAIVLAASSLLAKQRNAILVSIIGFAMVIFAFLPPVGILDEISHRESFRAHRANGTLQEYADTQYGRVHLGVREGQYQLYLDGKASYTFPDPYTKNPLIHLALCQHPSPQHILIAGGGAPDQLAAALAHNPKKIVLLYMDKKQVDLVAPYWPPATQKAVKDPRVTIAFDDIRRYLQKWKNTFDVIIVPANPPTSAAGNRFHTTEFYRLASQALKRDGSITSITTGSANTYTNESAEITASAMHTIGAEFRFTVLVPGITSVIHAANYANTVTTDPQILKKRFHAQVKSDLAFAPENFAYMLDPHRMGGALDRIAQIPPLVNTDRVPRGYMLGIQLFFTTSSKNATSWVSSLVHNSDDNGLWILWILVPIGIWALIKWGPRANKKPKTIDGLFSIFTTGAAGIGVELILIHAQASAFGGLYHILALLIAGFMGGIGLGALYATAKPRPAHAGQTPARQTAENQKRAFLCDGAVCILLLGTIPVIHYGLVHPLVTTLWAGVAGCVTGAAFPVLLELIGDQSRSKRQNEPAQIEAADHIGAAFGAIVTSIIWLPSLGITWTCVLFAILKIPSMSLNLLGFLKSDIDL